MPGYKVKKKTMTVVMDGDWKGIEMTGLTSFPWSVMRELAEMQEEQKAAKEADDEADVSLKSVTRIEEWMRIWLTEWNLEDEKGKAIPVGHFDVLPAELVTAMFGAVTDAIGGKTEVPPPE